MSSELPIPRHRELLETLRRAFPQPVSDPVHDAYFVFSILRALDQVDALKSQAPILGRPTEPNYAAAQKARLADGSRSIEAVIPELVSYLEGMFIWGHPQSQVNVVPNPSIASIIGVLLPAIYNPNLCSDESAHRIAEAEVRVISIAASLVGYDTAEVGGVFTFGGTGGLLYGVHVGLEKALPGSVRSGVRDDAVVLVSEQSHYSCLNGRRLAGHRSGQRDCRADAPGQLDRRAGAGGRCHGLHYAGPPHRRDRGHDGHDRRLWHRRSRGDPRHARAARRRSTSSTTGRTSTPTR